MRARYLQTIQYPDRILGEHLHGVGFVGLVTLPRTTVVEGDGAEGLCQLLHQFRIPCRRAGTQSHDHQERLAASTHVVVNIDIANSKFRHMPCSAPIASSRPFPQVCTSERWGLV